MSLLTLFGRKKVSDDKLSTAFVNSLVTTVEEGFSEVAGLINEDSEFVKKPSIDPTNDSRFLLIVLVGNIKMLGDSFDVPTEDKLKSQIFEKAAAVFDTDVETLSKLYSEYSEFMSRVNHPSKNMVYAMARAVFYKYELNKYQSDYFKNLNTPNPIFLKKMSEVMTNFVWNWESFFERYKVSI
jgi:hypothetical protein